MSFTDALQSAFERYFDVSGRASRAEQASFVLFAFAGTLVFLLLDLIIYGNTLGVPPLAIIFVVVTFVPFVTVMFRRLHDTNRSAWWLLTAFVPVLGWLALLYFFAQPGTQGDNAHGSEPLGQVDPADFGAIPAE